ncbi:MAG: hypothetical protein Q8P95_03705 [bacterium]|nr:hypothetical protein [bacterium]
MRKIHHTWRFCADERLWRERRVVYAAGPDASATATLDTTREEEAWKQGEAVVAEHRGKNPDQAQDDLKDMTKLSGDNMQRIMDNWKDSFSTRIKGILGKQTSKNDLQQTIEDAARARVEKAANGLSQGRIDIKEYANDSLAVIHERRKVMNEMSTEIKQSIKNKEQRIASLQKNLGFLKGLINKPEKLQAKDLQEDIARLEEIQASIGKLDKEAEIKEAPRKAAEANIAKIDANIRATVLTNINLANDPDLAWKLDQSITAVLMGDNPDSFEMFLNDHKDRLQLSDAEREACYKMMDTLQSGTKQRYRMRKVEGAFTAKDSKDYMLKRHLERGELNVKGENMAARLDRLQNKLPVGQQINLGQELGVMYVIEKPSGKYPGFVLRGERGEMAFLNTSNPDRPKLSYSPDPKAAFGRFTLSVEANDKPSLVAVEFKPVRVVQQPAPAATAAP